jgi:hypothetical protein
MPASGKHQSARHTILSKIHCFGVPGRQQGRQECFLLLMLDTTAAVKLLQMLLFKMKSEQDNISAFRANKFLFWARIKRQLYKSTWNE